MVPPARVLVVDDDAAICAAVAASMTVEGFVVHEEPDGRRITESVAAFLPDVVLLDWMMPGPSGIQLAATLRSISDAAVIMLTARDEVDDRLRGFAEGADDYVSKPFAMAELVARTTAVLRRRGRVPSVIEVGDLMIDPDAATTTRGDTVIDLTATEFRLLSFLAQSRGRTLSKGQILTQVWGYDDYDPNLVEVHLSSLRRKMERTGPRLIHTVRGMGYRLASVEGG